jgi:hypothetical protein
MKSFAAEVVADNSGKFCGNGLRFSTFEAARQGSLDALDPREGVARGREPRGAEPMNNTGYVVAIDGTEDEIRVATTEAAQAVADRYGRRVRIFCRWTRKYIGDLAPRPSGTSSGHSRIP